MKVVKMPIEMIAWFTQEGIPHPIKFRLKNDDESWIVVKVNRIISRDIEKLAGNKMIVFTCQSIIKGVEKIYEVKYEVESCKWMLFKI